eukprot:3475384-Pyramimonas_sp.AAC.1
MSPPWNYIRRPPCYASVTRPVTHPSPSLLHMRHPHCYTCGTLPVTHASPSLLHIRHPPCYTSVTLPVTQPSPPSSQPEQRTPLELPPSPLGLHNKETDV